MRKLLLFFLIWISEFILFVNTGPGDCSNVTIIPREAWGARDTKATVKMYVPVDLFFIHHTAGPSCNSVKSCSTVLQGIQDFHMDVKGWDDIAYSFLVGEDGNVYEGRGWDRVGAHTKGYNSISLAASFIGNYTTHLPVPAALNAVKNLIKCGIQKGKLSANFRLLGHRDVGHTECPGDALYREIQTWPHYYHGNDSACHAVNGKCQNHSNSSCSGCFERYLCTTSFAGNDSACHAVNGKCKNHSNSSCGGCYVRFLCAGSADRRCCVPKISPDITACNDGATRELACKLQWLADDRKIVLWDRHPSGVKDNAYAYNNVRDACQGRPSSRSKYTCKECPKPGAPGGEVCLRRSVLQYIHALYEKIGYIHVNEIAGACHSCNSRHYLGLAVDIDSPTALQTNIMVDLCNNMCGTGIDEKNHIHCQF